MTDDHSGPEISRRNLFGGVALGLFLPQQLSAREVAGQIETLDPTVLHMVIRGLAMIDLFADPMLEEDGAALLDQIQTRLPEAPILIALYRSYRATTAGNAVRTEGSPEDLLLLHHAVAHAQSVKFQYTDLEEATTNRSVLPLAIVHPPQGIQLLCWCQLRADYRKFYVRSMGKLARAGEGFADRRMTLLEGLAAQEIPMV